MPATDPANRPSAEEALKRLQLIVSSQSYLTLHRRLVGRGERINFQSTFYENAALLMNAALRPVKFAIGIPSRTVSAVRAFIGSGISKKTT